MLQLKPITVLPEPDLTATLNLRPADSNDIAAIYDLVKYWADKGRMLERSHELLAATLHEFLVLENQSANGSIQAVWQCILAFNTRVLAVGWCWGPNA
jgi:amino-acid N-acetyltransferase